MRKREGSRADTQRYMLQEGYWYGLPLVLISGGLLGFWLRERSPFLLVCAIFFLVLAFLLLNFFRDPERPIPTHAQAIISPADGRIVQVVQESHEGRPVCRVSIFMSPLDVHVNRAPIAGVVREVFYRKGAFRVASQEAASVENEQNVFTLEGEQGHLGEGVFRSGFLTPESMAETVKVLRRFHRATQQVVTDPVPRGRHQRSAGCPQFAGFSGVGAFRHGMEGRDYFGTGGGTSDSSGTCLQSPRRQFAGADDGSGRREL